MNDFDPPPNTIASGPGQLAVRPELNLKRVARHLAAVEGYLELGLPKCALEELTQVPEAGPLEAVAQLFRGEALQALEQYADAIPPLDRATSLFPPGFNLRAAAALSNCYQHAGQPELANAVLEKAFPGMLKAGTTIQVNVVPIFRIQSQGNTARRR